jgi:hypothetical protein
VKTTQIGAEISEILFEAGDAQAMPPPSRARNEGDLDVFDPFIDDTCPRRRKPVKFTVIEPHPSDRDLARQDFGPKHSSGLRSRSPANEWWRSN